MRLVRCFSSCFIVALSFYPVQLNGADSVSMTGHVYDDITNLPIEGAVVRVLGSSIAARTEAPNGLFTLIDIPSSSITNGAVELLITKDGYRPETLVHIISEKRASIALSPVDNLVRKWLRTLREGEASCESRQTIVETIQGFGIDHSALRLEAEDALLEVFTSANFNYAVAERFVAEECLRKLRDGKRCDDASEVFDKKHADEMKELSEKAEDPVEKLKAMQVGAVLLAFKCSRLNEEEQAELAKAVEGALTAAYIVVRVVPEQSVGEKLGLQPGDVLISYDGEEIDSVEEWNQASLKKAAGKKEVLLEVRKQDGSRRFLQAPAGDLGIVVGSAQPGEVLLKETGKQEQ